MITNIFLSSQQFSILGMKFSIITVNYNNAVGLQKTVESVVCQTFKDYEHIIIDGGSTDGSNDIILKNKEYFSYWCSEPDKGIYHAMNKGVSHASGEYLLFLNSGDVLHDNNVLRNLSNLETDADIIIGLVKRMDNGHLQFSHLQNILMQLIRYSISHQGTLLSKSLFDKYQYDESLKILSDQKFFIESIICDNCSFTRVDIIVADMDVTGISHNPHYYSLRQQEREKVLQTQFQPLILQTLTDYSEVYFSPLYKHLIFLKDRHSFLFTMIKRCIHIIYVMFHKTT